MMRFVVAAAMASIATAASAAPLPPWLLGRWLAVALMETATFSDMAPESGTGRSHSEIMFEDIRKLTLSFRPDAITSVPSDLYDLIEGDGLSASEYRAPFHTLYTTGQPDQNYRVIGQPVNIEAETQLQVVSVAMKHCVLNPSGGRAVTRDGHLGPPRRADRCDPALVYRLPGDRIGWQTTLGWLVLEREPTRAMAPMPTR